MGSYKISPRLQQNIKNMPTLPPWKSSDNHPSITVFACMRKLQFRDKNICPNSTQTHHLNSLHLLILSTSIIFKFIWISAIYVHILKLPPCLFPISHLLLRRRSSCHSIPEQLPTPYLLCNRTIDRKYPFPHIVTVWIPTSIASKSK